MHACTTHTDKHAYAHMHTYIHTTAYIHTYTHTNNTHTYKRSQANHPIWGRLKKFAERVGRQNTKTLKEAAARKHHSQQKQQRGSSPARADDKDDSESVIDFERKLKLKEYIKEQREKLLPILLEYDQGEVYSPSEANELKKGKILKQYNICGDKALHMCMLMAYRYGQGSSNMRDVFINLAKELIEKREQQYGQDAAPTGQNSGFHADVQPNGQDASLSRKSSTWQR